MSKKGILFSAALALLIFLVGCSGGAGSPASEAQSENEAEKTEAVSASIPTPAPTATPTPAPTPEREVFFTVYGQSVSSFSEEIDLSEIPVDDNGEALERLIPQLPHLKTVIMSDCGVPDEQMEALDERYPDIRFIWTIHFGRWYYLRTDETAFIASLFQGNQSYYTNLSNEEVMKLRYCKDMVALDLGHMSFTTIEFVKDMPRLKWFIIADTNVEDLTPLADHEDLYYLEIFGSQVKDISPLLSCPSLRHLNISWCDIQDTEDLCKMTYLDRLWYMSGFMSLDVYNQVRETFAGTDTELQLGRTGSSVGGTWRAHPAYYEMRDAFGVFYIAPP